jgi:hypothetical protein
MEEKGTYFLQKPFTAANLATIVRKALDAIKNVKPSPLAVSSQEPGSAGVPPNAIYFLFLTRRRR